MKTIQTLLVTLLFSTGLFSQNAGINSQELKARGIEKQTVSPVVNIYNPGVPSGTGTSGDPYLIASYLNLQWLANQVNTQTSFFFGKYFKQTADITLPVGEWTPIGNYPNSSFKGTYYGENHTISGLTVTNVVNNSFGLFGVLDYGSHVEKLGVINVNINAPTRSSAGALAGMVFNGEIFYCYSTGSVSAGGVVGGLVGSVSNCYMVFCYSYANVTMNNNNQPGSEASNFAFGGLVGNVSTNCTIDNCYSRGAVNGYAGAGGLVGYNSGVIKHCYSTGAVTGTIQVGGLVGHGYSALDENNDGILDGGIVKYSFWDSETSGKTQASESFPENMNEWQNANFMEGPVPVLIRILGVQAKSTASMKTQSTFTTLSTFTDAENYSSQEGFMGWQNLDNYISWSFNQYGWQLVSTVNDGYPSFGWQPAPGITTGLIDKSPTELVIKTAGKALLLSGFSGKATLYLYSLTGGLMYENSNVVANQYLQINVHEGLYIAHIKVGTNELMTKIMLK